MSKDMTTADEAITHLLVRIRSDPRLAYYIAPLTQSMALLTAAHAEAHGLDVEAFRKDYYALLRFGAPQSAKEPAPPTMWVIWSNEHQAYWRPRSAGYTRRIEDAGRYTCEEARAICFPGRGRAHRALESTGDGDWPPPEMMFPDPEPHAPALQGEMWQHFGRQLK